MDLQSGSSITATQKGKNWTHWENGLCCRGMENKMLLMYLVKVKKRRKCKFTPYNILQNSMYLYKANPKILQLCIKIDIFERNHDIIFIISVVGVVEKENPFCVCVCPELKSIILIVHTGLAAVWATLLWLNMNWSLSHSHVHAAQRPSESHCCWHLIFTTISIKINANFMRFSLEAFYPVYFFCYSITSSEIDR